MVECNSNTTGKSWTVISVWTCTTTARFYDLFAEKYHSVSPYAYCANNPVKYIDPDGNYLTEEGKVILILMTDDKTE